MKRFALCIVPLLTFAACHPHAHVPPSAGFYGVVETPRIVRVFPRQMTPETIAAIPMAIARINAAAGREVLKLGPPMTVEELSAMSAKGEVPNGLTVVGLASLAENELGITQFRMDSDAQFLGGMVVALSTQIMADPCMLSAVVEHELCHSVGMDHAAGGQVRSNMQPAYIPGQCHLTAGDVAALQAAYL